jgi:hypothetical protein
MTRSDGADDERALRKQRSERLSRIMWAYICGAITLLSYPVGLGPSFIPLGFAVLGGVLAWQLMALGERQHSTIAGALALGGIMIWFTYNWSMLHRYIAG